MASQYLQQSTDFPNQPTRRPRPPLQHHPLYSPENDCGGFDEGVPSMQHDGLPRYDSDSYANHLRQHLNTVFQNVPHAVPYGYDQQQIGHAPGSSASNLGQAGQNATPYNPGLESSFS